MLSAQDSDWILLTVQLTVEQCRSPIHRFFFHNKSYSTTWSDPWLVESTDVQLGLQKADCKLYMDF